MLAIYKKELKSYFTSVIACLFIAVTTLISGIFFVIYNLTYGATEMYSAYNALLILIFTIPILTMKIIADEKRLKTDQLILSSPISVGKVVLGKYLALLTIYCIPILIMCIYPIILSSFGDMPYKMAYTNILGLFLYGLALIAIGMFVSSITESQVISAILSIVILFIGYIMSTITGMISTNGNILTKIMNSFDLLTPANEFMSGVISLKYVVYYITITVLFLFFTCQAIQKRRWSVSKKTLSFGVFNSTYIVIAVVIAVVVNLACIKVSDNASWGSIDMTSTKLYSVSKTTKDMLKKVSDDVTVYVMSSKKSSDKNISKTLSRYENASEHIKVEYKDTTLNPNFYSDYTDTAPTANSLIVVNKKNNKSKVVDYNSIYVSDQSSYYYQSSSNSASSYDCEGQLDSAISYVLSENTPTIYEIEGHGEVGMGTSFSSEISKMNCEAKTIKLPSVDSISTNECDFIMLLGPTTDYSKDDAKKVIDYLNAGGKAIIAYENYQSVGEDKPNFDSILETLGIKTVKGVVVERDSSYYSNNYGPFYVFADGITGYASGLKSYVLAPYAKGLQQKNKDDSTITYTALSSTSKAISKANVKNSTSYDKEDGDIEGTFDLAVYVNKTLENEDGSSDETNTNDSDTSSAKQASALVLASVYTLDEGVNEIVSDSNLTMFTNAIKDFADTDVETVSVPAKSLQATTLTISATGGRVFGIILAIVVPLIILISGIVVWVKRRKR